MKHRLTSGALVAAATITLCGIPSIAAAHAGNDDPKLLHVCIGNNSKLVRSVGVSGSCIAGPSSVAETADHWSREGIPGIPGPKGDKGDKGDTGDKGEKGDSGTNGIDGKDGANATRADGPCFANVNRYIDCGNGTVTDTVTGLIWLKNASCLPPNDWASANQAAAALKAGDCGLTDKSSPGDWRLPTDVELSAMIASGCPFSLAGGPALRDDSGILCYGDGTSSSFVGVASDYWTSTTVRDNPLFVRIVDLANGTPGIGSKGVTRVAWPVRSR